MLIRRQSLHGVQRLLLAVLIFGCLLFQPGQAHAEEECYNYGDIRIVLSWNTNNTDIDTHVYDPNGNHAWYGSLGGIPGGQLDYDDVDGLGPETFTMAEPVIGTYQVQVHYFADHNEDGAASSASALQTHERQESKRTTAAAQRNINPSALSTNATVRVFVGNVLKSSTSHTLSSVDQTVTAHTFTICGSGKPIISKVTPTYDLDNTRYLEAIPVQNKIGVSVNWLDNEPGRVEYKLNNELIATIDAGAGAIEHTIDMGSQLASGANRLEIIAYPKDEDAEASDPASFQFYSIPQPLWIAGISSLGLGSLPVMASGSVGGGASYEMGVHFPNSPFTIDALRIDPLDKGSRWSWGVDGTVVVPLSCSTPPAVKVSATGGVKLLDADFGLTGYTGISAQTAGACSFTNPVGNVGARVNVSGNIYRKPVLVMVSYLNVAVGTTVNTIVVTYDLEEFVGKLGEFYIDGSGSADSNIKVEFLESTTEPLRYTDFNLTGELGMQGGYRADLHVVSIDIYAGASGSIAFMRPGVVTWPPTDQWTFDKITLKGKVGAKLQLLWAVRTPEGEISWTYPPTAAQMAALMEDLESGEWQVMAGPTNELNNRLKLAPDAAQFLNVLASSASSTLSAQSTTTATMVSNVYSNPELAMALNSDDSQALFLWVDTDPNKAAGQAHEIYMSHWSYGTATQPAAITNDTLLDGAPKVAWADDGQGVAVWHRMKIDVAPDATLATENLKKIEIATASYNPLDGSWSAPSLVTDNDALDATPELARNDSGQLLAIWRRNLAGRLSGNAAEPDEIVAAFYQSGWSVPTVAVGAIPGLGELNVGYGSNHATIAFTRQIAPTGSSTPTSQIFISQWNGTSWSTPTQLTNEGANFSPQVLYNSANQPLLVWQSDNTLHLRNLSTTATHTLMLPGEIAGVDEFYALRDSADNIAAVFVSKILPRDLYVSYFDQQQGSWSQPRQLTADDVSERALAPALTNAGQLLMGYAGTTTTLVDQTSEIEGETVTYKFPQEGQTDLLTLMHNFESNLTINPGDLTASRFNPPVGSTIVLSATVHNSGDHAIGGVAVAFYKEYQSADTLIASVAIPGIMPGNSSATVTTNYTIPTDEYDIIAVVDPDGLVAESDEYDNQATRALYVADLQLLNVDVRYWGGANADLSTTLQNQGMRTQYDIALSYRVDAVDGREVYRDSLSALGPGESMARTAYLDLSGFEPGTYFMVANASTMGDDGEPISTQSYFSLAVLPDLQLSSSSVESTPLNATNIVVTGTVTNIGAAPTSAVEVGFYRGGINTASSLLFTRTLPALAPAGEFVVTGQTSGPLCAIYMVADPTNQLAEIAKANNIASTTRTGGPCADFGYSMPNNTPLSVPFTVQFLDFSTGSGITWHWDFGDGTTSLEQNPIHTFTTGGNRVITLTVADKQGVIATSTRTISGTQGNLNIPFIRR